MFSSEKEQILIQHMEELARMGAYEVDLARMRWKASHNFLRLFHLPTQSEFTYQDLLNLIHPDDLDRVRTHFDQCLAGENEYNISYRCIIDGQERFIQTRSRIEREADGTPVRLVGIKRDITEESQLQALFQAAPSGMLMVDQKRRILMVNAEIERIFGYVANELQGKEIEVLLPERYRMGHPQLVEMYMNSPVPRAMGEGRDLTAQRKDGTEVPVEIGLHPIFLNNQLSVICSVVDITERQKIAEREARQKQELKDFAYRIAHDIRNPLTNLKTLLELSSDEDGAAISNEEARQMMSGITTDLLQFAEEIIGASLAAPGESVLKPLRFDSMKDRINQRFSFPLLECEGSLNWIEGHSTLPQVPVGSMEEIVGNLVSNSLRYRHPERAPAIQIRTGNEGSTFWLAVEDNGRGISAKNRDRIFEMFGKLQDEEGTGLGLYLVKENLNRLGGSIDFESSDQGSRFRISLPLFQ